MKAITTVQVTGVYASSATTLTGTKREVLAQLRLKASLMRRNSRKLMKQDNVHSLITNKHQSPLVNLASYQLNQLGLNELLNVMNAHGVLKFKINN
jgi:hypothetical protein